MGLVTLLSLALFSGALPSGVAWAGAPSVNVGEPALQFSLPALNDDTVMELVNKPSVSLADFAGVDAAYPRKVTVIYFCSRKSGGDGLAELERVAKRFRGKDAQIVAVLTDAGDVAGLSDWITGLGLTYPVLRDQHRIVAGRYGLSELPVTYVLDAAGDVFAVGNPKGADVETEVTAAIEALLDGQ